jgi:hypothetical protein
MVAGQLVERYRLSQILVLPPYQRGGHGSEMLQAVYREGRARDSFEIAVEVTMENQRSISRIRIPSLESGAGPGSVDDVVPTRHRCPQLSARGHTAVGGGADLGGARCICTAVTPAHTIIGTLTVQPAALPL